MRIDGKVLNISTICENPYPNRKLLLAYYYQQISKTLKKARGNFRSSEYILNNQVFFASHKKNTSVNINKDNA